MKPKYLLDECNNTRADIKNKLFVRSVDLIGIGASDQEVLKLSKSLKIPIVTSDKRFALSILLENESVVYRCKEKTYLITPNIVSDPGLSDPVTHYLLKTQSVIIA